MWYQISYPPDVPSHVGCPDMWYPDIHPADVPIWHPEGIHHTWYLRCRYGDIYPIPRYSRYVVCNPRYGDMRYVLLRYPVMVSRDLPTRCTTSDGVS